MKTTKLKEEFNRLMVYKNKNELTDDGVEMVSELEALILFFEEREENSKVIELNEAMVRKIEIHIETTEDCLENFNLDKTTKELLVQDNNLFKEIVNYKK